MSRRWVALVVGVLALAGPVVAPPAQAARSVSVDAVAVLERAPGAGYTGPVLGPSFLGGRFAFSVDLWDCAAACVIEGTWVLEDADGHELSGTFGGAYTEVSGVWGAELTVVGGTGPYRRLTGTGRFSGYSDPCTSYVNCTTRIVSRIVIDAAR